VQSAIDAAGSFTGDYRVPFPVSMKVDLTVQNQYDAMYSIITICLVIVILFVFTGSFNNAVNRLVVQPLENMMKTLRNSAMLMIKSLSAVDKQNDDVEDRSEGEDDEEDDEMETAALEKMVQKLSKIVQHVLPGNSEIVTEGQVDASTLNWLNEAYSMGATKVRDALGARKSLDVGGVELDRLDKSTITVVKESLNSWEFDVLQFSHKEIFEIIIYQFSMLNLLNEFNVPMDNFQKFLVEVQSRYIESNTYHNFKHGFDVLHTVYRLLLVTSLNTLLSDLEVFSILIGSLAHDIGHPGINNVYLVKAKHELAMAHNDRSPLENMHCVVLYEILSKNVTNIFVGLSTDHWRESRKIILAAILGTDMSHHFEQISKTKVICI